MLNLHGDPSYSPTIPWMSKFQGGTQKLVADFITHLDDSGEAEGSAKEAWRAARRVGLIWQYLGLQYAPRKRRIDRQDGGLWRGEKFHIIYWSIYQLIGEGKWAKNRIIIKNGCKRLHKENPWTTRSCKVIGDYWIVFFTHTGVAGHFWKEYISPWTCGAHIGAMKDGNRTHMDWTVIYRKKIWAVRLRKLWAKLLDHPARGMLQKRFNLRWSYQRNFGFMTHRLSRY